MSNTTDSPSDDTNDATNATLLQEEVPEIKMSQEEKQFIATQAYEAVFKQITIEWNVSRSVYEVQERLESYENHVEDVPTMWAGLCADDYYAHHRRFFPDSLTIRQEWIDCFIGEFLKISKKLAETFKDPYGSDPSCS